jgi:hypothetical protein
VPRIRLIPDNLQIEIAPGRLRLRRQSAMLDQPHLGGRRYGELRAARLSGAIADGS